MTKRREAEEEKGEGERGQVGGNNYRKGSSKNQVLCQGSSTD